MVTRLSAVSISLEFNDCSRIHRRLIWTFRKVPATELYLYGTVWHLTQGEIRETKRVRLFTEFVSQRLAIHAPLFAGLSIPAN